MRPMNTEYFWWLAALVALAAGGLVVILSWRDRGGLDALAAADVDEESVDAAVDAAPDLEAID